MARSARPSSRAVEIVRLAARDAREVVRAAALFDGPPVLAAARRYLADPRNLFLLARAGDRPVGFLRGTTLGQVETNRPQFFLYEVAVDTAWRRQGVGRALVERMLAHCRRTGHAEAFVLTDDPRNRAAHALYRSTGAVTETRGERMYVYRLRRPSPRGSPRRGGA